MVVSFLNCEAWVIKQVEKKDLHKIKNFLSLKYNSIYIFHDRTVRRITFYWQFEIV